MKTKCRFASCTWSGDVNDLLNHCDGQHQKFVKDIQDDEFFNFSLENIIKDTFLLFDNNGIYWFLLKPGQRKDRIRRGIFAIGNSETREYTIRLGGMNTSSVAYLGPYKTRSSKSKKFDIVLSFRHLEYFKGFIPSKSVKIYFRETEDKDMSTSL